MKLAVVGSINMDMIVHTERIPLKGETLRGSDLEYQPGGKGANQAVAMAKLGAQVTMFGCVGNDSIGEQLIDNLTKCGVDASYIEKLDGVPSGLATITVGECDNAIVIVAGANDYVDVAYVERYKEKILEADMIVLQNEIPEETIEYVIRLCFENYKKVVWNPAPARSLKKELLDMITYITPNEHEVRIIWEKENKTLEELLREYQGKLIVTRGEKGVSICKDDTITTIPAMRVRVTDTTGAGDTLNGAFCVGLSMGMDEVAALRFANVAAGLSVQKCGAQMGMPVLEEVEKILA